MLKKKSVHKTWLDNAIEKKEKQRIRREGSENKVAFLSEFAETDCPKEINSSQSLEGTSKSQEKNFRHGVLL